MHMCFCFFAVLENVILYIYVRIIFMYVEVSI